MEDHAGIQRTFKEVSVTFRRVSSGALQGVWGDIREFSESFKDVQIPQALQWRIQRF